jgi:protein-S-isoprenylcysteine O-methyltransferase Ste14
MHDTSFAEWHGRGLQMAYNKNICAEIYRVPPYKRLLMDRDNPGVIAPPPLIAAAGVLVGLLFNQLLPITLLPEWVRVLGPTLIAIAMSAAFWALVTMICAGTHPEPSHPTTTIVTSGPFRFTRNPIYLSYTVFMIGLACLTLNLWMLAVTAIVWMILQRGVIRREERYLERKFGDAYVDYKRRVRRWL